MQLEEEYFTRRRFLQWTAAGAAALGSEKLLQGQEQTISTGTRQAPADPIVLRSGMLEVVLDARHGLPYEFHLLQNDSRMRGEDFGLPVKATVCRKQPWDFAIVTVMAEPHHVSKTSAAFHFQARYGDTNAATFELRYELRDATVIITLDDIKENSGFELIDVDMPRLVTVREADGPAWLAHGDTGGSLVLLSEAKEGSLPPNTFWGNILGTLPVVMVGTQRVLCVQETTAYMDGTALSVTGASGQRRASLGTTKVHRVNGSGCQDLNLGRGVPHNCGNQGTPNLLVEQPSSCRLDFLPFSGDMSNAWLTAGKLIRDHLPEIPTRFYSDKYVYGIRCDEPLYPKPSATFSQCEEVIAEVAALTDRAPQVVHLWGWQFKGKDTGYPAVNVVDERIGGYDGMMHLMERGNELNATVTLSDNYDDAYQSSPAWNEALIARRPDGQLWKSRSWTGEESYILGLAKFMDGPGVERVRYTCERYKLKKTTHVDVLSYYAIRNDWDPQHPASGVRNLVQGRYRVLKEFRDRGIDVSSEALRYPMIGHMSCYWYLTGPSPCPFGGKPIPLIPLIYGKSAVWGLSGPGARGDAATVRMNQFFYGARAHSMVRADVERADMLDAFYLTMVPWFALHARAIEGFQRNGDQTVTHLEGNTRIEIDWAAKNLRVVLNGVEVMRNDAVYCPLDASRIACYAASSQTVTVKLPDGWNTEQIEAESLYTDKHEKASTQVRDGKISVALDARRPVILYRNKTDARS